MATIYEKIQQKKAQIADSMDRGRHLMEASRQGPPAQDDRVSPAAYAAYRQNLRAGDILGHPDAPLSERLITGETPEAERESIQSALHTAQARISAAARPRTRLCLSKRNSRPRWEGCPGENRVLLRRFQTTGGAVNAAL